MQTCDAPDATGHLFHSLQRQGQEGRRRDRVTERETSSMGRFLTTARCVQVKKGKSLRRQNLKLWAQSYSDGHWATPVDCKLHMFCGLAEVSGGEPPKLTLICRNNIHDEVKHK